jgi:hypothetical protein
MADGADPFESLLARLGRDLAFLLALAVHLAVQGVVWLGLDALASRGSARRGPRAARRSA